MDSVRLDKWLYAVRIFKTRAVATDACQRGRVLVNGIQAKSSKEIKLGDKVTVRKLPVIHNYEVKGIIEKRVSAKLVPDYLEDHTSLEELDKLKIKESFFVKRDRGTGRPTKKERREIDKLNNSIE
jgi:ribosome-associated heat shock protein Hsp15